MPKPVSFHSRYQQPISWARSFVSGMVGATAMIAVLDCFAVFGVTPFSLEMYLGTMLSGDRYSPWSWTIGVFATLALGGIFGFLYGFFFEYVFHRASAKIGLLLGLGHAVIAAIAFFPFFQIMHQEMGTLTVPAFGFFGSGMGIATPILLLAAHAMFGVCQGTFYGPVHADRHHAQVFEPGSSVEADDPGKITHHEDHPDSRIVNW